MINDFDALIGNYLTMAADFDPATGKTTIGKYFIDDVEEGPYDEVLIMLRKEGETEAVPTRIEKLIPILERNCEIYGDAVVLDNIL